MERKRRDRVKTVAGVLVAIVLTAVVTAFVAPSMMPLRTETITETETALMTLAETVTETVTTIDRSTATLWVDRCEFFLREARRFLESQYVEECGLLRAATRQEEGRRIYVASDNLLAQRALELLGSPLADEVRETLWIEYSGGYDGLHEGLLGENITWPPKTPSNITLGQCGGFDVIWEIRDGSIMNDWGEYGDLLACHAIAFHSESSLEKLLNLFDSKGIRDRVYETTGLYETYKLAMAILAYRSLQPAGHLKTYEAMVDIMLGMQRGDGGVVTHYDEGLGHVGDANTETTSLAVMALLADP